MKLDFVAEEPPELGVIELIADHGSQEFQVKDTEVFEITD
jgi:hypothetical protein